MTALDSNLYVAVLGHTGFVGGAIFKQLKEQGIQVTGASSKECDLLDLHQVELFLSGLPKGTWVVLSSAILRHIDNTYIAGARNIEMANNFVAATPSNHLGGLVFISSVDVYGRAPDLPITERTLPAPFNYYGMSKLAGEHLVRFPDAFDCPVSVLRLPSIYGGNDPGFSVVSRFLKQLSDTGRAKIFGDGSALRDFIEVGDVCEAVKQVITDRFSGLLNVATGTSVSIKDLVETLANALNMPAVIAYEPSDPNTAGDVVFDVAALRAALPNLNCQSLAQGSAKYVAQLNLQ